MTYRIQQQVISMTTFTTNMKSHLDNLKFILTFHLGYMTILEMRGLGHLLQATFISFTGHKELTNNSFMFKDQKDGLQKINLSS